MTESLPIIDIGALRGRGPEAASVATALDRACGEYGFFYATGHGIDPSLGARLMRLARQFFALPLRDKMAIEMARGGRAWRGYFPVDGELTSGRPDRKEGIYFGTNLAADDPRVQAGLPLHGANLYPPLPEFRETLDAYMSQVTAVAQLVLRGIAAGLGLGDDYFLERYTRNPTVLFRIFNYPPASPEADDGELGVGEHTDYGLLTLLQQDDAGGLQVWHRDRWLAAPPVPDSFVCNVGDMLERLTGGRYVSALHRVRNVSLQDRISMPLFLDPGFDAVLAPIIAPDSSASGRRRNGRRWDDADLSAVSGSYGDYLLGKVSKVFPELKKDVL